MLKRTRNVQKILDSNPIIAKVDTENVAFYMNNDDLVLLRGSVEFAQYLGETVWNFQGQEEDDV